MMPVRLNGSLASEKAGRCWSQSVQSRSEGIEGRRVDDEGSPYVLSNAPKMNSVCCLKAPKGRGGQNAKWPFFV